jgi:hypothetical protein
MSANLSHNAHGLLVGSKKKGTSKEKGDMEKKKGTSKEKGDSRRCPMGGRPWSTPPFLKRTLATVPFFFDL